MNFGKRYAKERLVSAYIYSDYYLTFFEELHTFKCNRGHESAGRAGSFTLSRAEVRRPATALPLHCHCTGPRSASCDVIWAAVQVSSAVRLTYHTCYVGNL